MKYLFIISFLIFGCTNNTVSPSNEVEYYRIKVTNIDGTIEYSTIISDN